MNKMDTMRNCLSALLMVCCTWAAAGQSLQDINFAYLYSPDQEFTFELKPIRQGDGWLVSFKMELVDTSLQITDFIVQWEGRESLSAKASDSTDFSPSPVRSANGIYGVVEIRRPPRIIVAKVIQVSVKRAWIFYQILTENYPVTSYFLAGDEIPPRNYVNVNQALTLAGDSSCFVSYYDHDFPAAVPPFSERLTRVSEVIRPDSIIRLSPGERFIPSQPGLYLLQRDTSAVEGMSFRVEADYPRLNRLSSLVGPLVYICSKQEYDRLVLAKEDKRSFDRILLNITSDADRARKLMRSYFRRVEIANRNFTSYKEGWKTDRGMVLIIYGPPHEVYKFADREVWIYQEPGAKTTFNFVKSSSIFDPDNYVLIRDDSYRLSWYETVDLLRSARF